MVASLVAAALLVASSPIARADGDPASDYLVGNQVFLTSQSVTVSPAERGLLASVRAANRAGFAIRVALISSQYDLGSITALWLKPAIYARFLGLELAPVYKQRLLVVMPNGFGFNWPGHPVAPAYRLLSAVGIGRGGAGVALAAQSALRRLATAAGVTLPSSQAPESGAGGRSGGSDLLLLAIAAAAAAAAIAAAIALPRARPRRRLVAERPAQPAVVPTERPTPTEPTARTEPSAPDEPPTRRGHALPIGARWLIPSVGLLCVGAAAAPILALRGQSTSTSAASVVTPPPLSWAAGRRAAPEFVLRDQNGRPVSIAAFRGRPVIVTFIDPLCRNLCPLEAQVLNQTVRQLPAGQRPAIVAVSVDVYADARKDLLQDVGEWHLVPEWRWAVGSPAQLAAVWKRYEVGVQVTTKKIAGTTINYITHTEAAYVVDGTGHERALFVWPFYPQDVKRVLKQLT